MSETIPYRRDIDGLRAIAVLLVVAFHTFPNQVSGGFIGVDIFFVISGFLITGIIVSDVRTGRFSFLEFYARRVRRLVPALAIVLFTTIAAGWCLLLPWSFADLGRHASASALFLENALLLSEVGYFDHVAELKPLLHLWSLGVEEQFYLVWPLLLISALKVRWSAAAVCIAVLLASFAANLVIVAQWKAAAFYLPFTRFWELMAGALVATSAYRNAPPAVRETLAAAGCMAIGIAVAFLNPRATFPGFWTLLPVIGASALVFSGRETMVARKILQRPVFVSIGLVSYPLYLWHWPILSIARNVSLKEPTYLERTACLGLAFALAYLTFHFVEKPFRSMTSRARLISTGAAMLFALAIAGGLISAHQGWPKRFPAGVQMLAFDYRAQADHAIRLNKCFWNVGAVPNFSASCDPEAERGGVVLWGDSFAAALYPGLAHISNGDRPGEYTVSGCPPLLGFESTQRNCRQAAERILDRITIVKPSKVILLAQWALYDGTDGWGRFDLAMFADTVSRLRTSGVGQIVVIGQFPVWKLDVPRIIARSLLTEKAIDFADKPLELKSLAVDKLVGADAAAVGADFISPISDFCRKESCRLTVPDSNGIPISYDHGHLTVAASRWFAEIRQADLTRR